MRLGKVQIHLDYVVDLDNEEMVQRAINALYEDLEIIFLTKDIKEFEYLLSYDHKDPRLSESDIEDFLEEEVEE